MDNKVSEKAIWEGSITPDNNTSSLASQMQTQPQMMFCYKCNNVIPSDSTFCPYCQIKLFAECPKCGAKYSSQYPACSKCGTNREEYLQRQRSEAVRKAAIERESRRRQEILEKEKREREQEEALKRWKQQEAERKQKEAYLKENAEIMKTKEYETTYSLIKEAFETCDSKNKQRVLVIIFLCSIGYIWCFLNSNRELGCLPQLYALIGVPLCMILCAIFCYKGGTKEKFLLQYTYGNNYCDKDMITPNLIKMVNYQGIDRLSDCCIIAYREKHGLSINYKWHNLK